MTRYFFHVYHDRPELDAEGEELPDARVPRGNGDSEADHSGPQWQVAPRQGLADGSDDEFANRLYVIHLYAEKPK